MIKAKGKADDSGGYDEASMSFNSSSFGNMKMQYKEKWNSAGSLTHVAFKDYEILHGKPCLVLHQGVMMLMLNLIMMHKVTM